MNQELWQYFKNCTAAPEGMRIRVGRELTRSGISHMETLCKMLEHEPDKVLKIRNIGLQSITVIQKVCEAYLCERGGEY